jgi:uncharacterized protein (DUF58 family)
MFKSLLKRKQAAVADPLPAGAAMPPRRVDPETLLRRMEWTVMRRLDGLLQGDYRTLLRGFGLDLADLREYQGHDDVRYIDWNVTARMGIPHVRQFHEDREVFAWFVLDLSGSVDFGSEQVRKRELSLELVAVLGRILTRHGNRVGAILYSGKNRDKSAGGADLVNLADLVIPARGGRRQVLHILDRMQRLQAEKDHAIAGEQTDLGALLGKAQHVIGRRSIIFVVSDFISSPGWNRPLTLLARRHEVVAVRLYDPLENELPDLGLVVMQDAETGEQLFVDTRDGSFRRRFMQAAERRESALRDGLAQAGVDCLELATDDQLGEALLRFTGLRKRRSQLAAGAGNVRKPILS